MNNTGFCEIVVVFRYILYSLPKRSLKKNVQKNLPEITFQIIYTYGLR